MRTINTKSPAHVAYSMAFILRDILNVGVEKYEKPPQENIDAMMIQADKFINQLLTDRNVSIDTIAKTTYVWIVRFELPLKPTKLRTFARYQDRCAEYVHIWYRNFDEIAFECPKDFLE